MSLRVDFTTKSIVKTSTAVKRHTFMDIGTNNYRMATDGETRTNIHF